MNPRRRRTREIPFSLDSFLDVVANVVGIIIRLILVAWVGARTYTSLVPAAQPAAPAVEVPSGPLHDPLEGELAQHRRELDQARERLLQQLRRLPPLQEEQEATGRALAALKEQRQGVLREQGAVTQPGPAAMPSALEVVPTLAELGERGKRLREEIAALEKLPPVKKVLHYRAPVSRPVVGEELHFECKAGRVTYIDFPAFKAEVEAEISTRKEEILHQGRLEGTTAPSGAFQMHYRLELDRSSEAGKLHSDCVTEPVTLFRGEPAETALAPGSQFRHITDGTDARQTVVTFWVYPDSFALFRRLRDYLYDKDVEVAARPLEEGMQIGQSSRHGSKSRGQ